jgi:tetratricopeptide (TPR) repeat protein
MPEVEDITDITEEEDTLDNAVEELYQDDGMSSDILEGGDGDASLPPKKLPIGLFEVDASLPPLPSHPAEAKKMGDLSQDDKYELMDKYRSDGNIYFKAGFLEAALKKYGEGMTFVKHCIRDDTDEKRSKRGRMLIHANKAAVYFKMEDWRKCIDCCNEAIEEDESYVKAYFRKGKSYVKLENFEEARKCFKKVEDLNNGMDDPALTKELVCDSHVWPFI